MTNAPCKSHNDLIVWRKAVELAVEVHRVTTRFPRHELFGLASQMRRAAIWIPSNVAEGTARRTTRDLVAFLHVARGSLAEVETQLLLAQQVGYVYDRVRDALMVLIDEVGRLLNGLISALKERLGSAP
jgi:four helix bundle protein